MSKLVKAVFVACLMALVGSAFAALQEGRDYTLVSPPQPSDAKGKVEVIEFFSYACPHCAHFEPVLEKWLKTLPRDVAFRRVPVIFRPQWEAPARLYYALDALGYADRMQESVFQAIHGQGINLFTDAAVTDWVAGKGVDRKKFADTYNSFSVQSKVLRAKQMMAAYEIPGVPMMVVAGKYRTPDNFPGSHEDLLKLVDGLIAKARAEQK
jgi:thiol:disulfide interchange protein DsbA